MQQDFLRYVEHMNLIERIITAIAIVLSAAAALVGSVGFVYAAYWFFFVLWGPSWPQAIYAT